MNGSSAAGGRPDPRRDPAPDRDLPGAGFTLLEVLISLAIVVVLLGALGGLVGRSLQSWAYTREHHERVQQADFALQRMASALRTSRRLLIPLTENPATAHSEAVRDVLAVTLDPFLDIDGDGIADADDDGDGRIDEDPKNDWSDDGAPGLIGIDDDGDGDVDEGDASDDDEDGSSEEDVSNGIDDDGDGVADEEASKDLNADGAPGVAGVDDDGDGNVDEGVPEDDDEDGLVDEDSLQAVVYRLNGTDLLERWPGPGDGTNFVERVIASEVSLLRVERLSVAGRSELVELTLELTDPAGDLVSLTTRQRLGAER